MHFESSPVLFSYEIRVYFELGLFKTSAKMTRYMLTKVLV